MATTTNKKNYCLLSNLQSSSNPRKMLNLIFKVRRLYLELTSPISNKISANAPSINVPLFIAASFRHCSTFSHMCYNDYMINVKISKY